MVDKESVFENYMKNTNCYQGMFQENLVSKIVALEPFSAIEYPEKLSAIVFFQKCNFRCKFCYNTDLLRKRFTSIFPSLVPVDDIVVRIDTEILL
jgi:pyruvate-formate lyase-activating enzyme